MELQLMQGMNEGEWARPTAESRHYRGPVQAVIFDWAGTTVDFGCMAPTAVFMEVFRAQGVAITPKEARGPMGMHKRAHIETLLALPEVGERWRQAHGRDWTQADVDGLYDAFLPLQLQTLAQHCDLIPGTLETVAALRARGIKIGSSTGYTEALMEVLVPEAARRGYSPDAVVCGAQVPAGRPFPWMCYVNAMRLGVYPLEAIVKVGDTIADIEEGRNAGMWTVGVVMTGNLIGLPQAELLALHDVERQERYHDACRQMLAAGAHVVIPGIADLLPVIDAIQVRLASGGRP